MPQHSETRIVPYTADQMYAVVADVERYPEFLPWCAGLTVLSRGREGDAEVLTARMLVAYHGLKESYVSRVKLNAAEHSIEANHVEGPFKRLDTHWQFASAAEGATVDFFIDFAFRSAILSALAGSVFGLVASRMAQAFITRAESLYGSEKAAQQV